MRNELLGYLIGALESDERARLESALANDDQLRGDLDVLRSGLTPLAADTQIDPPLGLARRTVDFVFLRLALQTDGPANGPAVSRSYANWTDGPAPMRRWRMADISVAAGILVAALSVVVPAIIQSRANAQRLACQDRMQSTHGGLAKYADLHNGALPIATVSNSYEGKAGVYAPLLNEAGLLRHQEDVVCPASELAQEADRGAFRLPSIEQLERASGEELKSLLRRMGGSYAFAIGYRENGEYRTLRLRPGADFPLMADPPDENGEPIGHHGGCGRNVLFADGSVVYIGICCRPGTHDRLFTNDQGLLDAGVGRNDTVLFRSDVGPQVREVGR